MFRLCHGICGYGRLYYYICYAVCILIQSKINFLAFKDLVVDPVVVVVDLNGVVC